LVTAIITEEGVIYPPYGENLRRVLAGAARPPMMASAGVSPAPVGTGSADETPALPVGIADFSQTLVVEEG